MGARILVVGAGFALYPTSNPSHGPCVSSVAWALQKIHHTGLAQGPSHVTCASSAVKGLFA
eukprot:5386891-Pleurochrysis_carterae.AAC.1